MSRPPKKSKERLMYEKKHKQSLNKQIRKERELRNLKPNAYPVTRLILIRDFLRSTDLYKAIGLFVMAQIAIISVSASITHPHIAGALNLLAAIISIVLVIVSIREINKRQRKDDTRRPVNFSHVVRTLIIMIALIMFMTMMFALFNIELDTQPNQETLNTLTGHFPLVMILIITIVSPIVEELVFRELIPYAAGPSYVSFIVASIIFIVLHAPYGLLGWLSYTILSCGFLLARLSNNNVYTAIIVHMIWNILSLVA